MQKTIMNISDQTLYEVLGTELKDSAVIDARMQQAYEMIREKSRTKNNGAAENEKTRTVKIEKGDTTHRKNGNTVWRKVFITIGSMAAVLCVTCIFCVMNPVMAREIPFLGDIFGKIADVYPFGKLPGEGTANLLTEDETEPEKNEGIVSEEASGAAHGEEIAVENDLVSTDGGITISITEEYASNQALYIGIKVENEEAFPEMVATIDKGQQFIKARTMEGYSFWTGQHRNRRYIEGKFVDEHTFLGAIRADYDDIRRSMEEAGIGEPETDIPEAFVMELEIMEIVSTLKDAQLPEEYRISDAEYEQMTEEEQTAYMQSIPRAWYGLEHESWHQAGTWKFTLPVRLTDENARRIPVNQYDDEGIGVESIEISSIEMRVNTVVPDQMSLYTAVFDAEGRQIETSNGSNAGFARLIEGHDISRVTVYLCDLPVYFELEETCRDTGITEEMIGNIARYQVSVPISVIAE